MAFLAICYLFCKNSSKILPGRKQWLNIVKIVALVSFSISVVIFFWQLNITVDPWALCHTWFFLLIQSAQLFTVIIFIVSGMFIRKSIVALQPLTSSEQKFVEDNRNRALRQIHMCLVTLTVYTVYNLSYSLLLRFAAPDCT
jgi:hypothetical protein